MTLHLLCRNKTADFARWWEVFRSHAQAHRDAGLHLEALWRNADDMNEVHFLFEVEDRARAEAFMAAPEAAEGADASGVVNGEYTFVEWADGY